MTDKDILRKVFEKVKDELSEDWKWKFYGVASQVILEQMFYYPLIFSHDFAKGFWGTKTLYLVDTSPDWAHDEGDLEKEWLNQKDFDIYLKNHNKNLNIPKLKINLSHEDWQVYFDRKEAWQYHLQQMVLEKEPLRYLEKFL